VVPSRRANDTLCLPPTPQDNDRNNQQGSSQGSAKDECEETWAAGRRVGTVSPGDGHGVAPASTEGNRGGVVGLVPFKVRGGRIGPRDV
jgi:hypothetical protein